MKVTITVSHNLPEPADVQTRVNEVLRANLGRLAVQVADKYRTLWTGWLYKGRPPGAPRGGSQEGWTAVSDTGTVAASVINQAGDYRSGRSYVAAVHRTGTTTPAWKAHYDTDIAPMVAPLLRQMHLDVVEVIGG